MLEDDHVAAQHHGSLGSILGIRDTEVTGQDGRNGGIHLRRKALDVFGHELLHQGVQFSDGLVLVLAVGQQALADRVGDGCHLDRSSAARRKMVEVVAVGYRHVGHVQGTKDLDAGGASFLGRQVVVAHQQYDRDSSVGKALDPPGELAAVGGVGIPGLVGVASKEDQVYLVLQRIIHHLAEAPQEVHDPAVESGGWVKAAIVLYADVEVG